MFAFSPPVLNTFSSFGGLKKIKKVHFSQGLTAMINCRWHCHSAVHSDGLASLCTDSCH